MSEETKSTVPNTAVLSDIKFHLVKDKQTYDKYVPESYKTTYPYDKSASSLPWLVLTFTKSTDDDAPFSLKIKVAGEVDYLTFNENTTNSVGTLNSNKKLIQLKLKHYIMFDANDFAEFKDKQGEMMLKKYQAEIIDAEALKTVDTRGELPLVTSTMPSTVKAGEWYDFKISTDPKDFANTKVYVKGYVTNPENVKLQYQEGSEWKDLPLTSGNFQFGTDAGFPLTKTSSNLKIKVLKDATYTVTTNLIDATKKEILVQTISQVTVEKQTHTYVTVTAGENCEGAKVKVGTQVAQFNEKVKVPINTKVRVEVSRDGYIPYLKELNIKTDEQTIAGVNLSKPKLTVTLKEPESVSGAVIKLNGQVVTSGTATEFDYGTVVNVEVTADGYNPYIESRTVVFDYVLKVTLVKKTEGKFVLYVIPDPANAEVMINGKKGAQQEVTENEKVTITVTKEGYEDYFEEIEHATEAEHSVVYVTLTKKKCTLTVTTVPADAKVRIDGQERRQVTVDYGTLVTVKVTKSDYISQSQEIEVTEEEQTLSVTLVPEDDYTDDDATLDSITRMVAEKNNYSYLNISRYFVANGITEEALKAFYMEFGAYVVSKFDYRLWRAMHKYFGHIDGIREAEPETEVEKKVLPELDMESVGDDVPGFDYK